MRRRKTQGNSFNTSGGTDQTASAMKELNKEPSGLGIKTGKFLISKHITSSWKCDDVYSSCTQLHLITGKFSESQFSRKAFYVYGKTSFF